MADAAVVLDASALLAILGGEAGADAVPTRATPVMSSVNLLEVASVLRRRGMSGKDVTETLRLLGIDAVPFDQALVETAADIHQRGRSRGLSLGDAVCLATAAARDAVVYTADRAWKGLAVGVEIRLLR